MSDTLSAQQPHAISDERLKETTGRTHKQWFKALDRAGAEDWDHGRIERWLGGKGDVDSWWAQSVTLEYESARGKDTPQSEHGTVEMSVSKSVKLTALEIWPFVDDDGLRRSWLDVEFKVRGRTPGKTLRLSASDGSRVVIALYDLPEGSDGLPRTRVSVTHSRLRAESDVPETKAYWKVALAELAKLAQSPADGTSEQPG
ncbi:MAG: hypothetical protein ACTHW1_11055 [Ancrocorticia sp.]|uniref:hypothetical protein n=1 Tax=Ancrocorticia sp. TaxID=2593684 RepID=UPI003F905EDC